MFSKTTKRVCIQAVHGLRLSIFCLTLVALLLGSSHGVWAQKNKDKVPPGNPFQALQRQIDALRAQLDEGEFEQLRVFNPDPTQASTLFWGPSDECSIGVDPPGGLTGLIERDPIGFRLLGPGGQGCRLIFGPTMDCTVEVDPGGPDGMLLRDVDGIRLLNPDRQRATSLLFGPTDECSLRIDPPGGLTGLIESDPNGLRLLGPGGQGCILTFGPTDDCRIFVNPPELELPGLNFSDPFGFFFNNSIDVRGGVTAEFFVQASSRDLKENIRPLDDVLATIQQLQGVSFDWKQNGRADIGFIAEEVQQVLPEMVTWDEKREAVQGVKYANIVAVTVEGIKAQQQQIDELRTENDTLRAELTSLQSRMDDLTAQMGQLLSAAAE